MDEKGKNSHMFKEKELHLMYSAISHLMYSATSHYVSRSDKWGQTTRLIAIAGYQRSACHGGLIGPTSRRTYREMKPPDIYEKERTLQVHNLEDKRSNGAYHGRRSSPLRRYESWSSLEK
ncbi:hypothetical protein PIB30_093237 [Stylosanthes scabra]|uniref:Uncharacterized protein n=1 Tax=Stylosanthes scabra TaxID=79078 RepID=A0ABU6YTW2_9FABA|nr:hypothetical protein [Stylosanthes scabra]